MEIEQWPPMGVGYFPAGDPRAGEYEPGKKYQVVEEPQGPDEISEEKAVALLEGGGFRWVPDADAADPVEVAPDVVADQEGEY